MKKNFTKSFNAIKRYRYLFIAMAMFTVAGNNIHAAEPYLQRHLLLGAQKVELDGYKIIVTDADLKKIDYQISGVCFSKDASNLTLLDDIDTHIAQLTALNVNSIRTYRPLAVYTYAADGAINGYDVAATRAGLNKLAAAGITVTVGFSNLQDIAGGWDGVASKYYLPGLYKSYVENFGTHPAILCFAFGNEYNYHYTEWFTDEAQWLGILQTAVAETKARCPNKLTAVVHGELPTTAQFAGYNAIPGLDLIQTNIYRGSSFGSLFTDWATATASRRNALVVAEFGRSSQNSDGTDTSPLQLSTITSLWGEIKTHFSDVAGGGYVFEYQDEAWKGQAGNATIGSEAHLGLLDETGNSKASGIAFAALLDYPKITVQPTNKSIEQGGSVNLQITASSTSGDISYQWYHNNEAIPLATDAILALTDVDLTNAGEYYVSLTNNVGVTTSQAINVEVTIKIQVSVVFDCSGGSSVADQQLFPGDKIAEPTPPTQSGYVFAGWYKEIEFINAWDFANDVVTGNTTLYAKWTATIAVPDAPMNVSAEGGDGQATVSFTTPASNGGSDITGYTVTIYSGGTPVGIFSGTGSPIIVPDLTNGTPYTFTVLATNSAGNSSESSASNVVTPIPPTPRYNIIIASTSNGNVLSNSDLADEGTKISLTITPDKNYILDTIKAYKTEDETQTILLSGNDMNRTFIMPASDVTISATFRQTTGINNQQLQAVLRAVSTGSGLQISGLVPNEVFSIYNMQGKLVYKGKAITAKQTVNLQYKDIYIIITGDRQVKVLR